MRDMAAFAACIQSNRHCCRALEPMTCVQSMRARVSAIYGRQHARQ